MPLHFLSDLSSICFDPPHFYLDLLLFVKTLNFLSDLSTFCLNFPLFIYTLHFLSGLFSFCFDPHISLWTFEFYDLSNSFTFCLVHPLFVLTTGKYYWLSTFDLDFLLLSYPSTFLSAPLPFDPFSFCLTLHCLPGLSTFYMASPPFVWTLNFSSDHSTFCPALLLLSYSFCLAPVHFVMPLHVLFGPPLFVWTLHFSSESRHFLFSAFIFFTY